MTLSIAGVHHVTAITANPQTNIDFYTGVLGLRLVKLTVNFDDPASYHLYYGDAVGHPGTILTFFAWVGAPRGRIGPPQVSVTSFAAPEASLDFWMERLAKHRVAVQQPMARFGEQSLAFTDPDGLALEIVATPVADGPRSPGGAVPAPYALRGFHSVSISEEGYEHTARLLTEVMGFRLLDRESNRFRYQAGRLDVASRVDLLCVPDARRGSMGAGVVHHVAFRTPDTGHAPIVLGGQLLL